MDGSSDSILSALDLNHLRILDTMLRERSVRQTAERLCLTPSAISHALAKLRVIMGDDLFVRTAEGMMPTPRTLLIAPNLRESLRLIDLSFSDPVFDPSVSSRSFRIACLPFVGSALLHVPMAEIRRTAPMIQIRVQRINEQLVDDLDAGRIDLAIGAFGRQPEWIESELVLEEEMVFVMRSGGPVSGRALTIEDLGTLAHVDVQTDDNEQHWTASFHARGGLERQVAPEDRQTMRAALEQNGYGRNVAMVTPDHVTAIASVRASDMIALVTRRAAEDAVALGGIELFELPYAPTALPISIVWHKRLGDDRGLAWLRALLARALRSLQMPRSAHHVAIDAARGEEEM